MRPAVISPSQWAARQGRFALVFFHSTIVPDAGAFRCTPSPNHRDHSAARRWFDRFSCGTPRDRTRRARFDGSARRFRWSAALGLGPGMINVLDGEIELVVVMLG